MTKFKKKILFLFIISSLLLSTVISINSDYAIATTKKRRKGIDIEKSETTTQPEKEDDEDAETRLFVSTFAWASIVVAVLLATIAIWILARKYIFGKSSRALTLLRDRECLIFTALYGSSLAHEVLFLRHFRDDTLVKVAGKEFRDKFNDFYYSFSPYVAEYISSHSSMRRPILLIIAPVLRMVHLVDELLNRIFRTSSFT